MDNYKKNLGQIIKEFTEKSWLWLIIIGVLIIILIIVLISGCANKKVYLEYVNIQSDDILYINETFDINVKAYGSGNLSNAVYRLSLSDTEAATLNNLKLSGDSATTKITPKKLGKFALFVQGEIGNQKADRNEKQYVVCKRLTKEALPQEKVSVILNEVLVFPLDLGEDKECYEDIKIISSKTEILSEEEDGQFIGKKLGNTKIVIKDGKTTIESEIEVVSKEIPITNILLSKSKIDLYINDTYIINQTIEPANATHKNLVYKSSNSAVAVVNNSGTIKALSKGKATISVVSTDEKVEKKIEVTVLGNKPSGSGSNSGSSLGAAPRVTSVKMSSNNSNSKKATIGNTITVKMSFNETIAVKPSVIIANNTAYVTCSGSSCTATTKVTNKFPNGKASLKISGYKNKNGVTGSIITNTSDNIFVEIYGRSSSSSGSGSGSGSGGTGSNNIPAPVLTRVTMKSNNSYGRYIAEENNIITVTMDSNQAIGTKPTVHIAGVQANVTCSKSTCTAQVVVKSTMSNGNVSLKITGYKNTHNIKGIDVAKTTDGNYVKINIVRGNLINNGGFENKKSYWTGSSYIFATERINEFAPYDFIRSGKTAAIIELTDGGKYGFIENQFAVKSGHIYYGWYYVKTWKGSGTTATTHGYIFGIPQSGATSSWKKLSERRQLNTSYSSISLGRPVGQQGIYLAWDDAGVIDLTAEFGSGNEPSKDWCDKNIKADGSY